MLFAFQHWIKGKAAGCREKLQEMIRELSGKVAKTHQHTNLSHITIQFDGYL